MFATFAINTKTRRTKEQKMAEATAKNKKRDNDNILVLKEPNHKSVYSLQAALYRRSTKENLWDFFKTFKPWLQNYGKICKEKVDGSITEATEIALAKSTASWQTIADGLLLIIASTENLKMYVDNFDERMKSLWRTVLLYDYVSHEEAQSILCTEEELFTGKSYSYYFADSIKWNRLEMHWFMVERLRSDKTDRYGYRQYESFITISDEVRGLFFPVFFPRKTYTQTFSQLPEGRFRTVSLETDSVARFPLFTSIFKQGQLPMKKKGITAADMKRAQKIMALQEIFPDDDNEFREHLRAYSYMQILAINEHKKTAYMAKKLLTYQDTLRDIIRNSERLNEYITAILYPHIKGLRQNQTQFSHLSPLLTYARGYLKNNPNVWVRIIDIYTYIAGLESDGSHSIRTALVFDPYNEQTTASITNQYTGRVVAVNTYAQEFGVAGLQSYALVMASLGMAEVAFDEKSKHNMSPFDGLEYVRLTPLGHYVLGVTDSYEPPTQQHEACFELDPDRLIIRSLLSPNPYAQLLMDTATPISKDRFQTSANSFLANCHNRNDVEDKISIFRQFIASDLPPLWQQFFHSLLQHCNPLQKDKQTYQHYTLQPDNSDLIHLITTDPVLRQIVVRAEGYRILVKSDDLRKFEAQLKKHGYLL